jgi:hypothetical protein
VKIRSSLSALFISLLSLAFMTITDGCLADTRVALVLGNGAYRNVPRLANPANDAADVAAALKLLGFETILATDLDRAGMDEAAIRFARAARGADIALLYYSGHALQFGGVNYLAPVDAQLTDVADLRRLVRLDDIVADLQQAKNLRVLVLDACRDNPFANELRRSLSASRAVPLQRGLAKLDNAQGMIVAYATQAGQTAEDGDGRNSPYTTAFLENIKAPEEIGTIFRRISSDVYESTKHSQLPELSLSIIGEFYLHGKVEISSAPQQSGLSRTLLGTPFDADEVPFLCDRCRVQIKTEFVGKPLHSALVVSFDSGYYWSTGRRTALEARASALAQCLSAHRMSCFVYAVDGRISWDEPPPPLPIEPWFSLNGAVRPFNVQDIGAIHVNDRDRASREYREFHGKALAIGPDWQWTLTGLGDSGNEAARIVLQRCGYMTHSPCRVAAIADSLVGDRSLLDSVPRSIPARPLSQTVTGPDYALTGPQLRTSEIPFVCDQCRVQIDQQLRDKPSHTALAISLSGGFWTTWGRASAEEARTRVLGWCIGAKQTVCFVYAVDGKVVWKEAPLDVPPAPWFTHAGEKPLAITDPIFSFSEKVRTYIEKLYSPAPGPKAIAFGEGGYYGYGWGAEMKSENEAARLALERCGFLVQASCRIIAVNDSIVVDTDAIAHQRH